MKKFYKFIIRITAIMALFCLLISSKAYSQLNVFIFRGDDAVTLTEVCQGTQIALTVEVFGGSGTGHTFTWSGDINPSYFDDFGSLVRYKATTPPGTYVATVDVVDDIGFSGSASVTVIVKPSPLASIVANGPITFCQGDFVELEEINSQVNVSYQWQRNFVNIPLANGITHNANQTGLFRLRVTNVDNGCTINSNNIDVIVNALPTASASNDGPYCDNQTINLTSGPDAMVSYDWTTTAATPFTSGVRNPTIPNATASNSGIYTVTVEDINGCFNTAQTTVLVYLPVTAGTIGTNHAICYNAIPDPITNQTAPSGGNNSFTYQWQWSTNGVDWNNLAGEEGLGYTPIAALTQTTHYRREAVTACGTVYSNVVTVTVRSEVLGGTIGTSQNICYNIIPNPFSNAGSPSGGTETWTYEWQYQEEGDVVWTSIPSSNNLTYTHPIGLIKTTKFRRLATDALCGFAYSNEITITVYNAINGGTIGSNQTICYGGDPDIFTDETSPSGGNGAWSYSWESKVGAGAWTPIGGALGLTYDPPAGLLITTSYRRLATNDCGTAFSNEIIVTVYNELNGGLIGTNHAICYNGDPNNLTSSSSASGGNESFTYLWQSSTDGVIWSDISGASALSYNPPAGLTQTTQFRRRASTGCGVVYSNIVIVTVYDEVLGGTIDSSQDICYNDTPAGFTNALAPSGGNGTWVYEWQYQPNGSATWTSIAGTNSLTYTPASGLIVTTKYRRQATNDCGTAYSNEVTVTVWDDVNGGQIGSNHSICYAGDPDAFTNETSPFGGSGPWNYSWESKVGAGAWAPIGGAAGLTYDPPAGLITTTSYRRLATNDCGTGYSNEIIVTVYNDLIGGVIGTNHTICYNGDPNNLTSTSPATGGNESFTYLWQSSTDGVIWSDIVGATALSYNPPAGLTQTTQFRRRATTGCGVIYSNIITVTVRDEVLGGTIANDILDICYDTQPGIFYQTATPTGGSNSWTYEWQYQEQGQPTWTPIAGSNSPSYTHPTNLTITTKFRRMATDALCGFAYSNEVEINVWENLNPGQISIADNEVCFGESPGTIQNQVSPTGGTGATTFYWEQRIGLGSWTLIVGATSDTYAVPTLTQTTSYRRWASNTCGSEHSNEITITVNPLPNQYNITGSGEYCEGSAGVAIGLDGSQIGVTYTLYLNGVLTTTTLAGTGLAISFGSQIAGDYTVYAQNDATTCNIMMLGNILVIEIPEITDNTILDNQLICNGSIPAQLTGSLPTGGKGAGTYDYQWYNSINGVGFVAISGATSQNYSPTALTQTTWYQREVISGPCSSLSNTIEVTVNQPIDNNIISAVQTICYNTSPDELTGTLPTQGSGSYTYQWQISTTGAAGPFTDIVGAELQNYLHGNLTANTWFRRIVRSLPCDENYSNVIQITVSPELLLTGFSTLPTSCSDSNDGEAEVNHTGGTAPYNYLWSNGQTTKTATGLFAGVEYTVTVTDFIGCPASGVNTVTITSPDPIEIDDLIITSIVDLGGCFGDAIGTIQVLAKGGTPNFTYSLFRDGVLVNTQTPIHTAYASFTGLIASNNYSVVVTDSRNCTPAEQNDIILAQPDQLFVTNVEITDALCYGEANGTITITASGGNAPYLYSIDGEFGPFVLSNEFTLGEGSYDVWVMDNNGCIAQYSNNPIYIGEPEEILVTAPVTHVTSCFGNEEGRIEIIAFPGLVTDYQYTLFEFPTVDQWVDHNIFENLPAGQYYPQARNRETGCKAGYAGTTIVQQPQEITFNVLILDHVTGCWYSDNGRLRVSGIAGGAPGAKQVSMNLTLTDWFASNHIFAGLDIGFHTVYVRDSRGCIAQRTVEITGPPEIIISNITLAHNLCFGDTDGEIHVTASGGTGTLTYFINGGSANTTGSWTNLLAGDYLIEIYDDNVCLLDSLVTITSPEELLLFTEVTDILCSDSGDEGIIRARGTGGTAPYIITLFLGGVQVDQFTGIAESAWVDFTGLAGANNYHVEIDDDRSCGPVSSAILEVIVPAPLTINIPVVVDANCYGTASGSITISANGGTIPYTFNLYDSGNILVQTLSDNVEVEFTNIEAGLGYYIEVTDNNSCGPASTAPFDLTEPNPIVIDPAITVTDVTCNGLDNGIISVTATGGTGVLYYTLLQGGVPILGPQNDDGTFSPLVPGTYVVSITDDENCGPVVTDELVIEEPLPINISVNVTEISCFGDKGIIAVQANEGSAPYIFTLYRDGLEIASFTDVIADTEEAFENLDAGDPAFVYMVTVTDANNCSISSSNISFTEPSELIIDSWAFTPLECFNENEGTITIAGLGGTLPYTYTLYDSESNQVGDQIVANDTDPIQFINLAAGTYTVALSDANSCGPVISAPFTLIEPDAIEIDPLSILITNISCFGADDGEISLTASGGTGDLYYTITQGGALVVGFATQINDGTFAPLEPGTYVVEITDDNACGPIFSTELIVAEPDPLIISTVKTDALCNGLTGELTAQASEGTAPYIYTLKDGADATVSVENGNIGDWVTFSNLPPGSYTLDVEDASGCKNSIIVTIDEPTAINAFIDTYQDPTCDAFGNSSPGIIIADATGGTGSYTFSIYRNASFLAQNTTGIFDELAPGEYYVEVFDTNGCGPVPTGTQTLTSPTDIVIDDIIITNVLCNGESTGQIEVIVSNEVGTPLFTITAGDDNWQTSNIFENLSANTYTLRVKDDNNCVISSMVTITEPEQLFMTIIPTPPTTAFDTDGSIEVNVTGGSANYWYELYIWNEGTSDWDILATQSNTPLNSHTFTNLGVGMYRVVVTDANGCWKDEVVPISQFAIVLVATNSLCHNDCDGEIVLTTIGADYVTLTWEKDGEPYDMDEHWNESGNNYINLCNGTYTAFATDDEGNEALRSIYVGPSDPAFNIAISQAECRLKGDGIDIGSINITYLSGGNGTPANNYLRWSYLLGAGYIELNNFNDMWSLNGLPAGSYRAVYSDINGCTDTIRPVVMPIEDNIFEVIVNHEGHYCFNYQATLIGNVTNGQGVGATYEWFKVVQPNSIPVGINSSTYITETLTETTNYRLDVYSSNGCFEKRDFTINVYPEIGPFIDLANPIFKNTEHFNDPEVISVLADTEYPIEILTQNADYTLSYSWNLAQFLNPNNEKNSTILFKTGTYEDFLTGQIFNQRTQKNEQYVPLVASVESEFNCVETFDLKAIILNRIVISNVFSPNGDGINDIWLVPHVAAFPNLEVKVLNRWGAIVWSAKGAAAAKGWNGNNSNGKPYPIGTYYYVINFNVEGSSKWKPISGSVTIVR